VDTSGVGESIMGKKTRPDNKPSDLDKQLRDVQRGMVDVVYNLPELQEAYKLRNQILAKNPISMHRAGGTALSVTSPCSNLLR
jgi:hypothetical protein